MSVTSANRLELLQIADAVAREKMIEPALVIEAMEDSLGKAARSRNGAEYDIRAVIDRKSGELELTRYREVVEEVENFFTELNLAEAREIKPDAEIGQFITDPLPPVDFGRIAAQSAKQVILQKVREAERDRQYEEFKDRAGTIINGVVKREEYGNIIVDDDGLAAILDWEIASVGGDPMHDLAWTGVVGGRESHARDPERGEEAFVDDLFVVLAGELFDQQPEDTEVHGCGGEGQIADALQLFINFLDSKKDYRYY